MCGIAGICMPYRNGAVSAADIKQMTSVIRHRGPDGEGVHLGEGIGLGHRRLSIIDLEGGDQPIFNEDKTLAIVFNGEIYNYKELRADLIKDGYVFQTNSDTEVIIHLYHQKGEACVEYLNGMFGFAIWDEKNRTLFAARDRMGEKPFYYAELDDGTLIFASEMKSILASRFFSQSEVDLQSLDNYFAYGYVPSSRSIFKNIKKLPAAHQLTWVNGGVQIKRFWSHTGNSSIQVASGLELIDQVQELISDSIRLRLRSDVPVGAFLSGGIDSSLIVAMSSEVTSEPLSTFSVGFSESEFDESSFARQIAEKYNTNHHDLVVGDMDLDKFPDLVRQFDEPFADPSAVPTYYVTHAASQHLKVCLSGDAGDELFAGYPQYVFEPAEEWIDRVPLALRKLLFGVPANVIPDHVRGKGWLRRLSSSGADRYQRIIGIFDSVERRQLLNKAVDVEKHASLFEPYFKSGAGEIESRLLADQATYLTDDILVKVDRNSMLNSLEVRVPFLDHRLIELANAIPIEEKMKGGQQKWILKELLRKRAPQGIIDRPKQGFAMPIRDWIRTSYRDMAEDLLLSPNNRSHKFVEPAVVRQLFNAHLKGVRDLSDRLWSLMWFEQWCREFKI